MQDNLLGEGQVERGVDLQAECGVHLHVSTLGAALEPALLRQQGAAGEVEHAVLHQVTGPVLPTLAPAGIEVKRARKLRCKLRWITRFVCRGLGPAELFLTANTEHRVIVFFYKEPVGLG